MCPALWGSDTFGPARLLARIVTLGCPLRVDAVDKVGGVTGLVPVCTENLNPNIVVMESAKDRV